MGPKEGRTITKGDDFLEKERGGNGRKKPKHLSAQQRGSIIEKRFILRGGRQSGRGIKKKPKSLGRKGKNLWLKGVLEGVFQSLRARLWGDMTLQWQGGPIDIPVLTGGEKRRESLT